MITTASRATQLFSRRRVAIFLVVMLSLAALYALLGFLVTPVLIERGIADFADRQLERRAAVGKVRVNPFLFRLELQDFTLTERDGAPIFGCARLLADFDPSSSIARWAWTLSEISFEKPDLHVDIGPDGKLNLALLLDKWPKTERRPDDKFPRVVLQQAAWRAGKITFTDRSGAKPAGTVIDPADLELHEISTLPGERGDYSVSARLADGGAVAWRGDVSLATLSSQGEIGVKGAKPLTAWRFMRDKLAIAEPKGEVDLTLHYQFAVTEGTPQLAIDNAHLLGRGIAVTGPDGKEALLALSSLEVTGGRVDLGARQFSVSTVELRDGTVTADVDPDSVINWVKLVRAEAPAGQPEPALPAPGPAAAAPSWKGKVEALNVAGMQLKYTDRSRVRPLQVDAILTLHVAADLALGGGTEARFALGGIALQLAQVSARDVGGAEPVAAFDTVALEGGYLDAQERQLTLGRVAVTGGTVNVVCDADGRVDLIDRLRGRDAGLVRRGVTDVLKDAQAEGRPWRFAIDSLELAGVRVPVIVRGFAEPLSYEAQDLRARMTGFRSDGKDPVRIEGSLRFAQGGAVTAHGTLRVTGDELAGRFKVDRFALKPLQPLLLTRAGAVLASGELTADIKADYRVRAGKPELRGTGSARVDNLRLNDAERGERLIGWNSLALSGISLSLSPDDLKVDEARVDGIDADVTIYKDRSLNLVKAIELKPGASDSEAAKATPAAIADAEPRFPITVGRVLFEKGTVDFSDLSLVLPFSAKVADLAGSVQGVTTDRASRATVRLEGRVDEYGLARVSGSLRPFQPTSFLDLNVVFRNVEMPPLSAYSATFAGRRIAAGRLNLDLQYKINDGALAGDNRVVLEKFTLGERVEAPGALNLPLDLAVALLTDSEGKIDIAVPVSGNVNDPKFSYSQVIWQAISNLITRIVTAPFRALAALFGGNAEQLEDIVFDPGRAQLLPPEREKLKRVAEGIIKRPQLRLVAEGQYGPSDRAALQRQDVEAAVAGALGRAPAAGKLPDPVDVMDAKTQRALEALHVQRNSEQALSEFAAQIGKTRGKPVDRVNAALALIGRGSADRDFYEALLKRLSDTAPVPDSALVELAAERARAVTAHLTGALAVAPERAEARTAAAPGSAQVKLALDATRAAAPDKAGAAQ